MPDKICPVEQETHPMAEGQAVAASTKNVAIPNLLDLPASMPS